MTNTILYRHILYTRDRDTSLEGKNITKKSYYQKPLFIVIWHLEQYDTLNKYWNEEETISDFYSAGNIQKHI